MTSNLRSAIRQVAKRPGLAAESVLFGLSGYVRSVLAAATAVLGVVVLAAGYLPARRASSIDSLKASRYE